jgi:hypothetical protein
VQTQAQLNRLESSVNRLSALLGQQGLMGQPCLIFSLNLFKAHGVNNQSAQSGFMQCLVQFRASMTSPVQSNLNLCKAQQCKDKSPAGEISLKGPSESKNGFNKCLAVGFASKLAPNNCTKWILDSRATDHMTVIKAYLEIIG